MYVFLSHSSTDAEVALGLCKELESNGIECFLAPRDIRSGYEYAAEIVQGIDRSDVMILILSNKSNTSPHVLREVERAVSKNIPLIVYRIEDVVLTKSMEYFLMAHQWVNGKTNDYQEMIAAIRNLNYQLARSESAVKKEKNSFKMILVAASAVCAIGLGMFLIGYVISGKPNNDGGSDDSQATVVTDGSDVDSDKKLENIKLGDEIVFGQYNDAPIVWRVLKLSDDKKEAVLITNDIITMKALDAPDSDRYNEHNGESYYSQNSAANTDMELQAFVRGNSDWKNSDLRAWLNGETEIVDYGDSAPTKKKMCEMKNGYESEPGFLSNFKDAELAAIKTTSVETKGNALSGEDVVVTEDKVYLLSLDELDLFKQAGVSMLAKPTAECLEQDESKWYQYEQSERDTEMFYWWLREPDPESSSKCYVIGTEYWEEKIFTDIVGLCGRGVRPVITVDLTSDAIVIEEQ